MRGHEVLFYFSFFFFFFFNQYNARTIQSRMKDYSGQNIFCTIVPQYFTDTRNV